MKVIELNTPIEVPLIPRVMPLMGDLITIQLINEFTNLVINLPTIWTYSKQRLIISFDENQPDFKIGNKYQITLKNGANVIYMGNLLIVKENTNLQNYTPSSQITQRFKSKAV